MQRWRLVNHRVWPLNLNRLGLLFVFVNLALLIVAHYLPGLFGGESTGELDHTRLTGFVVTINYPIFRMFASGLLYPSVSTLNGWSSTFVLGFNAVIVISLMLCLAIYWYCEGLLVLLLVRRARLLLRLRRQSAS